MSIAPILQRYLVAENVEYDVIRHDPTTSSARTAEACRISGDRLAKAIVLRRDAGYMLAVLPASYHLRLSDLQSQLGDRVEMATEAEIDPLFPDCAHGAVPPLGHCYALPLVVDDSIVRATTTRFVGKMLKEAGRPGKVTLDTMNLWIEGSRKELETVIGGADLMVLNEEEARQLTDEVFALGVKQERREKLHPGLRTEERLQNARRRHVYR